jgi:hypothetical protein
MSGLCIHADRCGGKRMGAPCNGGKWMSGLCKWLGAP